jgi:ATP-binding cassette subfamily C protein CydCD
MIAEAGDRLSGGQRARLLLARALVSERPVVILDEPFANIDNESKHILIQRLAIAKTRIILIVVTHEQDLLEIADFVITADDFRAAKSPPESVSGVGLRKAAC